MPTLMALITASFSAFLIYRLLNDFSSILGAFVSFAVWVYVFYYMRRYISRLKP
jgi:hypothetical protein